MKCAGVCRINPVSPGWHFCGVGWDRRVNVIRATGLRLFDVADVGHERRGHCEPAWRKADGGVFQDGGEAVLCDWGQRAGEPGAPIER